MIIDTHTHLYLSDFSDPAATVRRAVDAGVGHMIFPNVDLSTYEPMIELHRQFPTETSVAVGIHPTELSENWREDLRQAKDLLDATPDAVAVGEVGVDLYWDSTFRNEQMEAFGIQAQWAVERNLPIIIHSRNGLDETLEILRSFPTPPHAVMHSFTGTADDIAKIREVAPDIYFGINGIVTFKKSPLPEILPIIGLDHLLLETDAPYLAPTPMRGTLNESAYIVHTAAFIANKLEIPTATLEEITTANASKLFRLK